MGREFELKYRATPEVLSTLRRAYPDFTTIHMETTYYDTPDAALSAKRWTLRRRMENQRSVCTLKTTLPDGSRGEWETACEDITAALPRLAALGAPAEIMSLRGLTPTCGARFTRNAAGIPIPGGLVELALDEGVVTGGGRQQPLCEVEVEQKQGSDEDTLSFAAALAEKYHLTVEEKSKFRRALELAGR